MMINVVVPFSRPEMTARVLGNFQRQVYPNKRLIVVENNRGVGRFQKNVVPCTILRSGPHQSLAKNTALDFIEAQGGGVVAIFDDDDYYGPNYLMDAIPFIGKYAIVGKFQHFIMQEEGLFLIQPFLGHRLNDWCQGATQIFHTRDVGRYPIKRTGEDVDFCHDILKQGKQVYLSGIHNFCYMRDHQNHQYQNNVVKDAMSRNWPVYKLSEKFEPEYVTGEKSWSY